MIIRNSWNASKIKFLRKRTGLSQTRLAEILGTTQQRIAAWEAGVNEPNPTYQEKLTYIARDRRVQITLEDLDMKNYLIAGDDLVRELDMNWLSQRPEGKKSKTVLSIKVGKLKQARKQIDWNDYIMKL